MAQENEINRELSQKNIIEGMKVIIFLYCAPREGKILNKHLPSLRNRKATTEKKCSLNKDGAPIKL